jgi:phage-related baseplate assembly protein
MTLTGVSRPERVRPIAERYSVDPLQVLDNICYARAFTYEHQDALVTSIAAKMVEERFSILV